MPNFDFTYFTTLAILVFAVGGCEKMSPYVNELDNPTKEFPRAMIFMTIMVAITALLGSVAMGLMFDTNNVPRDLMMNGAYYAFGIGDMTSLYNWLMRLNAVVMPMRYLWVFVAYMALKKAADHMFSPKYQFTKNRTIGFGFGAWCFFFTAFACVMGIFPLDVEVFSSGWNFQFAMNILTPLILIGSGLLLPCLANKDK